MTDTLLEATIDEVGRDRVLLRASCLGWTTCNPPPKWVWWEIVRSVREENKPKETDE